MLAGCGVTGVMFLLVFFIGWHTSPTHGFPSHIPVVGDTADRHGTISTRKPPLETIVVYGVRPRGMFGLGEKDSADARGDAYFLLSRLAVTYKTCQIDPTKFDCNCEITCEDNVVTKYNLQIYTPLNYSGYRNCNPTANSTITNYSYYCDAGDEYNVGAIKTGTFEWHPSPNIPNYLGIWRHKMGVHTGGVWYSTMAASECTDGLTSTSTSTSTSRSTSTSTSRSTSPRLPCAWNATAVKVIDKACMVARYTMAVHTVDPVCFTGCPSSPYNTSLAYVQDDCWLECFVDTVFEIAGEILENIWEQAFASDDPTMGGCPSTQP